MGEADETTGDFMRWGCGVALEGAEGWVVVVVESSTLFNPFAEIKLLSAGVLMTVLLH